MSTDVPDGALSLTATFADAVLAAKKHLDEAEAMAISGTLSVDGHLRFAEGYTRLAQALQHGVPGQRF